MTTASYIASETEFDSLLKEGSLMVVDCTAAWCGPCKVVSPLMDKLAEEFENKAKVFKLDLDTNPTVAKRFGIRSIPAVMVFKAGKLQETMIGVKPYEDFVATVDKYL